MKQIRIEGLRALVVGLLVLLGVALILVVAFHVLLFLIPIVFAVAAVLFVYRWFVSRPQAPKKPKGRVIETTAKEVKE